MATRITVAALDARLKVAEEQLEAARKRSSHKPLGAKVGALHREVQQLRTLLGEQGPSPVLAGQISSLEQAVADLGPRVAMLEEGQQSLSERVDNGLRAVNGTLDEHGRRIGDLEASQKEADGRVTIVATSVARAHARIDRLVPERFNWIAAGITGGILLAVWFFWFIPADFGGDVIVNGVPTGATVGSQLDTVWGGLLGLLVVVTAAAATGYVFGRPGRPNQNDHPTEVLAAASATADTKVLPVAQPSATAAAQAAAAT